MSLIIEEKLQELRELSGGNNDLLIDLLGKYITNADKYLTQAKEAMKSGDHDKVQFAIHTLKGSSLSLGLKELGEKLTDMNHRARNEDFIGFEAEIEAVEKMAKEVAVYKDTLN